MPVSREGFVGHPRDWRCEMSSRSGCAGAGRELPCAGSAAHSIPPRPLNHPLVSLCFNFSWSAEVKSSFLFVSSTLQVSGSEEHR